MALQPVSIQGGDLKAYFLRDITRFKGTDSQPDDVCDLFVEFVSGAKRTIDVAIYDFKFREDAMAKRVFGALRDLTRRGVEVRIAYDHTKQSPVPKAKGQVDEESLAEIGGDPAMRGTDEVLRNAFDGTQVQLAAIAGTHLMHSKYIIRDSDTSDATVWMGSTNFTTDAWSWQENNIVVVRSRDLASKYQRDFDELWVSRNIGTTGKDDSGTVSVHGLNVDFGFAPGEGVTLDHNDASLISTASRRLKIASMVITSQTIIGAIAEAIDHGQVAAFAGIYDKGEMDNTLGSWEKFKKDAYVEQWNSIARYMVAKSSHKFSKTNPQQTHNFMHDKIIVVDDIVVTGSYNLSRNATKNAENQLMIHDADLADAYSQYIDELVAAYRSKTGPDVTWKTALEAAAKHGLLSSRPGRLRGAA